MKNSSDGNDGISDFSLDVEEFRRGWIDDASQPSVAMLNKRNWKAIVVAEVLNPMEAEWLAEASEKYAAQQLVGLSFEYGGTPELERVSPERDGLLNYNFENSYKYIFLTSFDFDFLYFKDQVNRFYLLCGTDDFLKSSYKCSSDTAKIMYFDYWVDDSFHTPGERQFLTNVWDKYNSLD
ncbi:hypothetical protein [Kiloniella laminariae]|uniref:hypothetical protein n=1 Tax=Kiloniella laminariae TaxID=454162 RepID=UPI0003689C6D|nr:hypothetical protein [Kiloniella laminariae]